MVWRAPMRRRAVLATLLSTPFLARAEETWPVRPVRIVVPFNPGGAIDALVRVVGEALTERLGQQVLVDPKPGANTILGSDIVAKSAPDGYTFLITTNSTHTNNPALYAKLPFDPAKDLAPVSLVSLGSILIAAKSDAPFSDLRNMARWVKELGRPATYGSWGVGSSGHLYGLMLEKTLGGLYNHVPYRAMPELSTFAEQLVAGFDLSLFVGCYAPAGTPQMIIDRLQGDITLAVAEPSVADKLIQQGQTPVGSTPAELAAVLKRETPIWADLIRQSGAKVE